MAGILDFLGGDSLKSMLGNAESSDILNKLTGDGQSSTLNAISEKTGVSLDGVSKIFENLTPMISNFFSGKGGNISEMITSFFDKNKDGNVMDDIMGGIGNLFGGNK